MKLAKNCIGDDTSFGGALKQKARLAKTTAFCINQYDEEKTDDLTYNMMRTNKVYKKNSTGHVNNTDRAYLNYLTTPVLNSGVYGFPVHSLPIELTIQLFPPNVVRKFSVCVWSQSKGSILSLGA